jgi:site-specific recombinase XerD
MCLEAGMTLKEIQERLGHKDIMTTDIYSHVTQEIKSKSIDKLANHMADVTNFN